MSVHVVLDFDCTLTARHLFHCLRSGYHYREDLLAQTSLKWDEESKQVVREIQQYPLKFNRNWGKCRKLAGAKSFASYIFGGEERLAHLRAFLHDLLRMGTVLHISTKGIVSEVVEVLAAQDLLEHFTFVEGVNDRLDSKVLYRVGRGFRGVCQTYFTSAEATAKRNLVQFSTKPAFIESLLSGSNISLDLQESAARVVYLDDDTEYYRHLSNEGLFANRVLCLHVGSREQYYATGSPGLNKETMAAIVHQIARLVGPEI